MTNGTQNCVFCDSARHGPLECNSPMRNKYHILVTLMKDKECPTFGNYNMKELKLIAFETPYENNLSYRSRAKGKCSKNLIFNPIPLSLSKNRLVRALNERWHLLQTCRDKYYNDKPENEFDDCPICYEAITRNRWCARKSKWLLEHKQDSITTPCNHEFCGDCWRKIHTKTSNDNLIKECPMCRNEIMCNSSHLIIHN